MMSDCSSMHSVTLKKYGIHAKFVTETDPAAFAAAIDEKTKAIYIESITNPKYHVIDIPVLAEVNFFPLSRFNTIAYHLLPT